MHPPPSWQPQVRMGEYGWGGSYHIWQFNPGMVGPAGMAWALPIGAGSAECRAAPAAV